MIVSHRHQFIFLKPKKTGGTSVELALSNLCGPGDVITPVLEEHLRSGQGPQNYIVPYRDWLWRLGLRSGGGSSPKFVFSAHSPGRDIRRHLGRNIWDRYKKVSMIRNPWDREVSRFFWVRGRPNVPAEFEEFVERVTRRHPIANDGLRWGLNRDGNGFLMRYENLADDYSAFVRSLGVTEVPELPHAKGETRPGQARRYREVYTDKSREAVSSIYRREIKVFGYEF
jgi:hypothetical protein